MTHFQLVTCTPAAHQTSCVFKAVSSGHRSRIVSTKVVVNATDDSLSFPRWINVDVCSFFFLFSRGRHVPPISGSTSVLEGLQSCSSCKELSTPLGFCFVFCFFFLCLAFIPSLELFLLYLVCRTFVFELNFLNSPAASGLLLSPVQNQFPTFLIKENSVSSSIPHLPHRKEGWNFVPRLI